MTTKVITKAINLLGSVLTEDDKEMQELVQQLKRICVQAPNSSSTIQLLPMFDAGHQKAATTENKGYQFRDDIVTIVPTACLIEDVQKLGRALSRAADPAYDTVAVLKEECATTAECLAEVIARYTLVPPDLQIEPSGSSLVAMGMENGIIVNADGKDIVCRAGHPISNAMNGACSQCDQACPFFQLCFDGAADDLPRTGRIAPMQMDIDLSTTDDDIVTYLDKALNNKP